MKNALLLLIGLVTLAGCQGEESTMTKDEVNQLHNPQKEMPKEAIEAMAKAGQSGPPPATR